MLESKQQHVQSMTLACSLIIGSLFSPLATAADVSYGELAAAIRSADYPCAQVLRVDAEGDNAWLVQCNSGKYNVSLEQNDRFNVTQAD